MTRRWRELRDSGIPESSYRWRRLRLECGWSMAEAARRAGIEYDVLARLEKGRTLGLAGKARDAIQRLAQLFGVEP